jgi:hypothetical protein
LAIAATNAIETAVTKQSVRQNAVDETELKTIDNARKSEVSLGQRRDRRKHKKNHGLNKESRKN